MYNKLTRDEKKYYDLEKQIASKNARKSKLALDEEKLSSTIHGKSKTFSTQYRKALLDETRKHGNPLISSPRYNKLTLDEKKWNFWYYDQIIAIGERAIIENGVISINLDNEWKKIVELSNYVDEKEIFDIIARESCEK